MYYDPELAMELERDSVEDQDRFNEVVERCGNDDPWTQRVALVTDILASISKKETDLMNCWDDEQRQVIESEISELLCIAKQVIM